MARMILTTLQIFDRNLLGSPKLVTKTSFFARVADNLSAPAVRLALYLTLILKPMEKKALVDSQTVHQTQKPLVFNGTLCCHLHRHSMKTRGGSQLNLEWFP
jgi:hypothetical protein